MNIGETIFQRFDNESEDAYAKRREEIERIFKNALSSEPGRKMLALLKHARHPMEPRFIAGRTDTEAAYIDGECSVVALLMMNSGINL